MNSRALPVVVLLVNVILCATTRAIGVPPVPVGVVVLSLAGNIQCDSSAHHEGSPVTTALPDD